MYLKFLVTGRDMGFYPKFTGQKNVKNNNKITKVISPSTTLSKSIILSISINWASLKRGKIDNKMPPR